MKSQQKIGFCLCEVYAMGAVHKNLERFCLFGGQREKKAGSFALVQRRLSPALFRQCAAN
jgi:hypothetical protein